jgi:uncharacterized protein YlxW (UPF0749 family)
MKALHGPSWAFDQEQKAKAKQGGTASARPMDQGQLKRMQKETQTLQTDINALEEQINAVKQRIATESAAVRELDSQIDAGSVYALRLKRVIALRDEVRSTR